MFTPARRPRHAAATVGALALAVVALLSLAPGRATAEVVRLINHEGLLLDDQGEPLEGAYQLTFRLYDAAAGPQENALWEETHDVQVSSGYYQLLLGSLAGLSMQDFVESERIYLGISINGLAELAPRQPLTAVPYALVAEDVSGHIHPTSVTVGGDLVIDESGRWVGDTEGLEGPVGAAGPPGTNCYDGLGDRNGDGAVNVADCVGAAGPVGPAGPAGGEGSPDTPQQILDKLNTMDEAPGSDLNADKVDGLDSTVFLRADRDTGTVGGLTALSFSVGNGGAPFQVVSSNGEWTGQPIADLDPDLADTFVRRAASHLYQSTRLSTLRIRATGGEFGGNRSRNVVVDGVDHAGDLSGLHLTLIDRASHAVVFDGDYDTWANAAAAAALTDKLNDAGPDMVAVLASYDGWEGALSPELSEAMMRCGASYTVTLPSQRSAYLLVGVCGQGRGNGLEMHQRNASEAAVEVTALLVDGALVGTGGGGGGAGGGGPVEGDLVVGANILMSNGELRTAAGAFGLLRTTQPGASGYVFQEADPAWGLYYSGGDRTFQFTRMGAGGAESVASVDLETGNIYTKGWIEAEGTITSHSQLRMTSAGGDIFVEHDGAEGLVGTSGGDLRLTPAGGDVQVDDRLTVQQELTVGAFPDRATLSADQLALPLGNGLVTPGVRQEASTLVVAGVGDSEELRRIRLDSRVDVTHSLTVDGTLRSDPPAGSAQAGGKLVLGGAGANGNVTVQDYNGDLRIYTRQGATQTVRIFGYGNGTANLDVEGTATFGGGLILAEGAELVVPGSAADSLGQIGVGTADPEQQLHIFSSTGEAGLRIETVGDGALSNWEILGLADGSLAVRDLVADQTRLAITGGGTVRLPTGHLDLVNHNLYSVNGLQFADPGVPDEGVLWHGTGAVRTGIYVAAHKSGASNADGALWFNSDLGFVWANDYGDDDNRYLMRLANDGVLHAPGRLGLGLASAPSHLLHASALNAAGSVGLLRLENVGQNNFEIISFGDAHPTRGGWVQMGGWNRDVHVALVADTFAEFQAGTSQQGIFLRGDTGNVGVGTASPTARLEVRKVLGHAASEDMLVLNSDNGGVGAGVGIYMRNNGGSAESLARVRALDIGHCDGDLIFETSQDGVCPGNGNTTEVMRLTSANTMDVRGRINANGGINVPVRQGINLAFDGGHETRQICFRGGACVNAWHGYSMVFRPYNSNDGWVWLDANGNQIFHISLGPNEVVSNMNTVVNGNLTVTGTITGGNVGGGPAPTITAVELMDLADLNLELPRDCTDLRGQPSGVYRIDPTGGAEDDAFTVYCDNELDGGGWTLILKQDGNSATFAWEAALWTNQATHDPLNASLEPGDMKNAGYHQIAFDAVRVGMKEGGNPIRYIHFGHAADSMHAVIGDGAYRATALGRETWRSLMQNGSLQPHCNREGFNAYHAYARARIGIISNQEGDCNSPDSRIGLGTRGHACGQHDANTCGNEATCSADRGDRHTRGYGYLFVRGRGGGGSGDDMSGFEVVRVRGTNFRGGLSVRFRGVPLAASANSATELIVRIPTALLRAAGDLEVINPDFQSTSTNWDPPVEQPRSCAELKARDPGAASGTYTIDPTGGDPGDAFDVYCEMSADGGGWTLVLKQDGHRATFDYEAGYWSNTSSYNAGSADLSTNEMKNPGYHLIPVTAVRVGMKEGANPARYISFGYNGDSLYSLISDGSYRATGLGRETWRSLMQSGSLQPHCNREGFNAYHAYARARVGIISNQEGDCNSPDSRIGLGTSGHACGQHDDNTCGNEATCSGDRGDRHTRGFGYLFVR